NDQEVSAILGGGEDGHPHTVRDSAFAKRVMECTARDRFASAQASAISHQDAQMQRRTDRVPTRRGAAWGPGVGRLTADG
ncbi:MAG: hypothetical protein C4346_15945, partial [Chloroflexota bacterium]